MTRSTSGPVSAPVALGGVVAVAVAALSVDASASSALPAALLLVGDARRRGGFAGLVGWLGAGSVVGGVLGYAAASAVPLPLSTAGAVGLGLALGGGLGAVSNLLVTEDGEADPEGESLTVEMDDDGAPGPRPADLFDGHPDPVLYVLDRGSGPVVRAANRAYAETFAVPADAIAGTPLDEVTMVAGEAPDVAAAVADGDALDAVRDCRTSAGEAPFRLRTVGTGAAWYLLYTPVDADE